MYLYFGNFFSILVAAFVFYLGIEYPLKIIMRITLLDWMSEKTPRRDRKSLYEE